MQKGVKMKTSPAPPTHDFAAGDVVFAKMKGYRHWPARIGEAKAPKNKIPIFFYGTHSTTFLFPKDVVHYWPNKKIYGQSFKRGGFDRAMWEIENDPAVGLQGQKKASLLKRLSESRRKQKSRRSVPADQNQQNTPAKEDTPPKPSAASNAKAKPPRHRESAQESATPPRGEEPPALKTRPQEKTTPSRGEEPPTLKTHPLEKTTPPRGEEPQTLKTHHHEKATPPREEESQALKTLRQEKTTPSRGEEPPALKTLPLEKTTPPRGEEPQALKTLRQEKTTPSRGEEPPALKTLRQKTTPIRKNLLSRRRDAAARQRHALNRKSPPTGSGTELRSTRSRPAATGSGEDEENARTRGQRSAACGAPPLPRLITSSRPDRKRPSLHTPGEEEKKSRRRKRRKMEEDEEENTESSQTKSRKSSEEEEEEPDDEERSKSLAEKRQSVLKSLQGLVTSTRGKATPTSEDTPDTSHECVKPPEATQSSAAKDEERRDPSLSVTESLLYRLHGDIRISMTLENPDVSRCLSALDELSNVSVSSRNIQNHSELIDTLRKMRWFRGSEDIMFKASMLYHRFKNIYLVGDPDESLSHEYLQALQEAGPAQSGDHARGEAIPSCHKSRVE